jgi:hypothetical protein
MQHDPQRPKTNLKPFIIASIILAVASLIVICLLTVTMAAVQNASR